MLLKGRWYQVAAPPVTALAPGGLVTGAGVGLILLQRGPGFHWRAGLGLLPGRLKAAAMSLWPSRFRFRGR